MKIENSFPGVNILSFIVWRSKNREKNYYIKYDEPVTVASFFSKTEFLEHLNNKAKACRAHTGGVWVKITKVRN